MPKIKRKESSELQTLLPLTTEGKPCAEQLSKDEKIDYLQFLVVAKTKPKTVIKPRWLPSTTNHVIEWRRFVFQLGALTHSVLIFFIFLPVLEVRFVESPTKLSDLLEVFHAIRFLF